MGADSSKQDEDLLVTAEKKKLRFVVDSRYSQRLSLAEKHGEELIASQKAAASLLRTECEELQSHAAELEQAIAETEAHVAILPALVTDLEARLDELRPQLQLLVDRKATLDHQQHIARQERAADFRRHQELATANHNAEVARLAQSRVRPRENRVAWNSNLYSQTSNRRYSPSPGVHRVRAYTRRDGTYVRSHLRSNPDGIRENNLNYRN